MLNDRAIDLKPTVNFLNLFYKVTNHIRKYSDFALYSKDRPYVKNGALHYRFTQYKSDARELHKIAKQKPKYDYYITLNQFNKHKFDKKARSPENLAVVNGLGIDLDITRTFLASGLNPNHFSLSGLIAHLIEHNILPTAIQFSGHGFHLYYLVKPFLVKQSPYYINKTNKNYKKIVQFIGNQCDEYTKKVYGVRTFDSETNTSTNYFRLSGSYNNKNTSNVQFARIVMTTSHVYIFQQLLNRTTKKSKTTHKKNLMRYKRYLYVKHHAKYYKKLNQEIERKHRKHYKENAIKWSQNNYSHKFNNKKKLKAYCHKKNSIKNALHGFIKHILDPKYELVGHRDLAMFDYINLLVEKYPDLTQKQLLNRFNWFVDKIIRKKLKQENKALPNQIADSIRTEIQTQYSEYGQWSYSRNYDKIMEDIGLKGTTLWTTYSNKRKSRRSSRKAKFRRVRKYHKRGWSCNKLSKKFHLSKRTIRKIL